MEKLTRLPAVAKRDNSTSAGGNTYTETGMGRVAVPLKKGETGGYFVFGINHEYLCKRVRTAAYRLI